MKKSLKWLLWILGISVLGIGIDAEAVNIYLRSGTTTCIYSTNASQTLQKTSGANQASIAFSAKTNTFNFYSAPLSNSVYIAAGKKAGGVIGVQNNGNADFQFNASEVIYDYDPTTGNQVQIIAVLPSGPPVPVDKNGKTGNDTLAQTKVGTPYTIPAGHMLKVAITVTVNISSGINGALIYNASGGDGKSLVQFPADNSILWPFGNFTTTPNTTITVPSSVQQNSTGNVASVVNAGAGAAYSWTITNGTITAGQTTRQITWTAGPAGSVSLGVAIVNGCASSGSASIVTLNTKTNQTVTFNPIPTHTYGDAPFTLSATASSGLPVTFSIASGPATVSGSTVTITGAGTVIVDATQAGNADCNPAIAGQSFAVNPKALTVSGITTSNKIYDGITDAALHTNSAALAGVLAGDVVALDTTFVSGDFADETVGSGKTVSISGLDIVGVDESKYTLVDPTTIADITARALAVSAAAANKVYDGTTAAAVTLSDNRVAGDSLSTSYTSASFWDQNVGNGKTVNVSGISVSGTDAGNYSFNTTASATANITTATLTITAAANTKTYDGSTSAAATPTTSGLQGSDSVTGLAETYDTKNAGTGKTLSVSAYTVNDGNFGNNYTVGTVASIAGVIKPAALTVIANDKSKRCGQPNPPLTASYNGFVSGENTNVLASPVALDTPATTDSGVGTYPITTGGVAALNYAINYVSGKLIVNPPLQLSAACASVSGNNQFIVSWPTVVDQTYQLEYTSDLTAATWTPWGSPVVGTGATAAVTNSMSVTPQCFFRVAVQ
jgi:hypothetical protein